MPNSWDLAPASLWLARPLIRHVDPGQGAALALIPTGLRSDQARLMSASPRIAAREQTSREVREGPILLKKSQVQDLGKSAQSRVTSTIDCCPPLNPIWSGTRRVCAGACGPPRTWSQTSPMTLEKFGRLLRRTFSTESARTGQSVTPAVESVAGSEAENICSVRAFPVLTDSVEKVPSTGPRQICSKQSDIYDRLLSAS
jgi:hypothetical protein